MAVQVTAEALAGSSLAAEALLTRGAIDLRSDDRYQSQLDAAGMIYDDPPDDFATDDDLDPDRLTACAYWRCGQLFEQRSVNHVFCRKACRSRQHKWERAQERKARRAAAKGRGSG